MSFFPSRQGPAFDSDELLYANAAWGGTASGTVFRQTFDMAFAFSATIAIGPTQQMASYGIVLYAGDVINKIAFRSGTVAAGTPTNWWFALYDPNKNLMSQTPDQTTAAWAANTNMDISLNAAQTIVTTGLYRVAIMMKATTVVNLNGSAFAASSTSMSLGIVANQGAKSWVSDSGLTTTAPSTIGVPSNLIGMGYGVAH